MSRIGKLPIAIPAGVEFTISDDNTITVKGPKGTLTRKLPGDMNIAEDKETDIKQLVVTRPNDSKRMRAFHGLTRQLLFNMVEGVTKGFSKTLEIVGTGWRAAKNGDKLVLSLGYSHPVEMQDPEGVLSTVETNTKIVISGIDKEKVGQYAADIRSKRPPEPYKGKGVKYQGEQILRKAGKSGKK